MVKRPLLLVLTAFILGSLLYEVPIFVAVLGFVVSMAGVLVFLIKLSKNRHDQVLLIVPVFLFLGYLLMNNQGKAGPIDSYIPESDSVSLSISGTIHSIQSSTSSYKILLSDVQYEIAEGQSEYVLVYTKDVTGFAIGNQLIVNGDLSKFQKPTNAYQFDEALYYKNQNIDYKMMAERCQICDTHVNFLSNGLYQLRLKMQSVLGQIKEEEVASSLTAMLLGEKSVMDEETKSLYELGGIAHIISISGLHVSLLGMAIFTLLQNVFGLKAGVVGSIFMILCYGILTNFSVSTNRAVIMLILMLAAKIAGRTYDLITALSLSGLFILLRQPMQVFQSGFLLSYGAVLGIAVIYPCFLEVIDLEAIKKGREWKKKERGLVAQFIRKYCLQVRYYVINSFLYQASIFLVTFPILLVFYYKVSTYSFLINLIVLPLMTYVVLFGLLGCVLGCFSLNLGVFFLSPAIFIIKLYLWLCSMVSYLPKAVLVLGKPSAFRIIVYAVLLVAGGIGLYKKYRVSACLFGFGIFVFFLPPFSTELTITSVDVGQGDCFVFQMPNQHVFLIDGGSTSASKVGKYRLIPYLYGSGIDHIDEIFVTHADTDHISAVKELLDASAKGELSIGCLIMSHTSWDDENYKELCEYAKQRNVEVCFMERGQVLREGDLSITCLHPTYTYVPESANDYSLVLSIEYKEFSMLCMGDLSSKGEEALMEQEAIVSYDVLKVGHHGSKYSSSEQFLNSVNPTVALISCGKDNQYGHPHKELITRLKAVTDNIYQTPITGMIQIQTDGSYIKVIPYIT